MNIKKEYIDKTRDYLKKLDEKLNSIDSIKLEIEDLRRQDKYQDLDISKAVFGMKSSYNGIDDLKIYAEEQIYIKETEIEYINKKYEEVEVFLSRLELNEKLIIELRYFKKKNDNTRYKLTDIAREINYSVATVKRIEKKVIEKIAVFKFGKEIKKECELKVS